jgi:hypothetical protein
MRFKNENPGNEQGIVAFLVVAVIATLLALITLGFSHLMGREVRQALDRQLSEQAYYAAEAGVNDARNYLAAGGGSSTNCAPPTDINPSPFVSGGDISGDKNVRYSCITLDSTPKELIYNLDPGKSISFKLTLAALDKLYFSWENQAYNGAPQVLGGRGQLPRADLLSPDATGLLKVGLYPVVTSCGGQADTDNIMACAGRNYYMYPDAWGGGGTPTPGPVTYSNANANGDFVDGNCSTNHPNLPYTASTPRFCNTVINGLNGVSSSANTFYVQLTAYYQKISISIQASDNTGANKSLQIPNVEGVVDATGTGNDVLRRLEARVPLQSNSTNPAFAIVSNQGICKGFRVPVVSQGQYGNAYLDNGIPNDDGICGLPDGSGSVAGGGIPPINGRKCNAPYTGVYPSCSCPPNSTDKGGTCACNSGFSGSAPNCTINCPANSHNTSSSTCACDAGYTGNPPGTPCTQQIPPRPASCNNGSVAVSLISRVGNSVTVSAGASGCQYYQNNAVGWNGGGIWTVNQPPGWRFCQDGGVDPWGFYAESCVNT